jgi:hypothetical protein
MKLIDSYREVARTRYFRRFLTGEGISSVGDAMSEVTIVVLALAIAGQGRGPIAVALATGAYLVPGILSSLLTGRHLGRWQPRTLLLTDNVWRGGWIGVASVLAMTDGLHVWTYAALLGLASLSRPLGAAGSRTITTQLLDERHLFAGNSMLRGVVQIATTVGPVLAGVVVAVVGAGAALGIDALSFLAYAVLLLEMPASAVQAGSGPHGARPVVAGTGWWRNRAVLALFVITAVMLVLYGPFVVGLPIIVEQRSVALPTVTMLGLTWSAFGLGAVLGGLAAGGIAALATTRAAALIAAGWGACVLAVGIPAPTGSPLTTTSSAAPPINNTPTDTRPATVTGASVKA